MAVLLNWQRESAASLFERIQKNDDSLPSFSLEIFVSSIKNNLNNILNTHPGTSQSAQQLGIIDLNDATSNSIDIYNEIAEIIKSCILNFEPRIVEIKVNPKPNEYQPLTLFFYVEAVVCFREYHRMISFNLHLDKDHHYYVDVDSVL